MLVCFHGGIIIDDRKRGESPFCHGLGEDDLRGGRSEELLFLNFLVTDSIQWFNSVFRLHSGQCGWMHENANRNGLVVVL